MRRQPVVTILMLIPAVILTLPMRAQQKPVAPGFSPAKPFTEEQISNMVRAGLGDDSGAKLIEQRGIDFAPADDFLLSLKAAGASEAFLKALRAALLLDPQNPESYASLASVLIQQKKYDDAAPSRDAEHVSGLAFARRPGCPLPGSGLRCAKCGYVNTLPRLIVPCYAFEAQPAMMG